MKIMALCGSLRAASINSALLDAAALLAPADIQIIPVVGLGQLPLYNPDLDDRLPPAVQAYMDQLRQADGLLIASPEYALGVTGTIKNALDWTVATEIMVGMPVALLNASHRAVTAYQALRATLEIMSCRILVEAAFPLPGKQETAAAMVADAQVAGAIRKMLDDLSAALRAAPEMTG